MPELTDGFWTVVCVSDKNDDLLLYKYFNMCDQLIISNIFLEG